jgi:RNA polymerase sigma-70 factor (sigma-E family)
VTRDEYHAVYVAHHARVVRLAYLLTGDRDHAEDAAAAAFVSVYPKWRDGLVRDAGAYLRKAAANHVRQGVRHEGVRERHNHIVAEPGVSPAGEAATIEHADVMAALRALPDDQRATIVLRFYGDFSEAETAEILGVAPGTVKSRTARAIERLRPLLKESSDD